jgi:hypothetical protein
MEKSRCKSETYKPLPDYLAIGPSDIHGAGIFAQDDVPSDIIVGISHIYDPNFQHDYIRTPLGGFINHSEDPNCELVEDESDSDYKRLKTIKKIESGKELTLKYSMYDLFT